MRRVLAVGVLMGLFVAGCDGTKNRPAKKGSQDARSARALDLRARCARLAASLSLAAVLGCGASIGQDDAVVVASVAPARPTPQASGQPSASSAAPSDAVPTSATLNAIWGSDATHIWAVGENGTIVRGDGTRWKTVASGTTAKLRAVWGTDEAHAWAVGDHTILRADGETWVVEKSDVEDTLVGVWAADPQNVFAIGRAGSIWKRGAAGWTQQRPATPGAGLNSVWGADLENLYAVGENGLLLRYNGRAWAKAAGPPSMHYKHVGGESFEAAEGRSPFVHVWGIDPELIFVANDQSFVHAGAPPAWWKILDSGNPTYRSFVIGIWGVDLERVWMIAATEGGTEIIWREAGEWSACMLWSPHELRGIWGADPEHIWAVGEGGSIVKLTPSLLTSPNCKL